MRRGAWFYILPYWLANVFQKMTIIGVCFALNSKLYVYIVFSPKKNKQQMPYLQILIQQYHETYPKQCIQTVRSYQKWYTCQNKLWENSSLMIWQYHKTMFCACIDLQSIQLMWKSFQSIFYDIYHKFICINWSPQHILIHFQLQLHSPQNKYWSHTDILSDFPPCTTSLSLSWSASWAYIASIRFCPCTSP